MTSRLAAWRPLRWLLAAAVAVAAAVVVVDVTSAPPSYGITAVFSQAPGLFAGAAVDVLGVQVGRVSSVRNVGDRVVVGLQVDQGRAVPARATAALVAPQLLGEPDIELDPGYTGGPRLAPGAVIPESRTAVPVSTDQLLRSLSRTLRALNPDAVSRLVTNLAADLDGQGQSLNDLIHNAAGTITLLADKGDDLGRLNVTLAQLTGSLDTSTAQLRQLLDDYDTVSGVVAQHGAQLGDALTQLDQASANLVTLLDPNLAPLEADVGTATTVGRTLDRNIDNIDQTLASTTLLFTAAQRAYDPTYQWLNLNLQTPTGLTGAYVAGLLRDRLAGVCRRVLANHSQGLTAAQVATLQSCGNPASGFFNPIVDQLPSLLNGAATAASSPASTPATAFQQGLSQIPGLGQAAAGAAPHAAPTTPSTTTTTTPSSGGNGVPCPTGLLGGVLGCTSTGSSGSTSSGGGSSGTSKTGGSGGSSGGGLGGLLSTSGTPTATTAVLTDPSLTAPAARLLPSAGRHHHRSRRRRPAAVRLAQGPAPEVGRS